MRLLVLSLLICGVNVLQAEPPPLEAYGKLPAYDLLDISPSGRFGASRVTFEGNDTILVYDMDSGEFVTGANAQDVNPRSLRFIDDDQLVLVSGETKRSFMVRSPFDYSRAHAFKLSTGEIRQLLVNEESVYRYQGGLGRIVGLADEEGSIVMPAFVEVDSGSPTYGIFRVHPQKRRAPVIARGRHDTIDWFLAADGSPLVREDFDDRRNIHRIWRVNEGGYDEELLYEAEGELVGFSTVGLTADRDAVVLLQSNARTGVTSLYRMSVEDGSIEGPVLAAEGKDINGVLTDINRIVLGVEYAGFKPTYAFFDTALDERVAGILQRLRLTSARLVAWSADYARLGFLVEGGLTSGAYLIFEAGNPQPERFGQLRPDIPAEHVVPVEITEYAAADGLIIPALVTVRDDVRAKGKAPLIVIPHGGPEAHDVFGFDWLAQYFASRGYMVLQPQFRGSDGFGHDHLVAGHGEWGGKMQSDLDDGVRFLIQQGLADADRVCMMGASYGGYASLAAGAFSPEMYRCIVSIAGVSDLNRKMRRKRSERGKNDWVLDYWEELYGAEASEKDELRALSPANHAHAFKAPVLLIHGQQDTVVHIEQSKTMNKALRKAGKDVTFVKLKGEDHWLTQEETRIEMLRAAAAFIESHL